MATIVDSADYRGVEWGKVWEERLYGTVCSMLFRFSPWHRNHQTYGVSAAAYGNRHKTPGFVFAVVGAASPETAAEAARTAALWRCGGLARPGQWEEQ